jgi:hypothetical protein
MAVRRAVRRVAAGQVVVLAVLVRAVVRDVEAAEIVGGRGRGRQQGGGGEEDEKGGGELHLGLNRFQLAVMGWESILWFLPLTTTTKARVQ